jgi:hypothetical protein
LFDPAVKTYLTELQQERDMEAAMEAEAAADAAAEAAAAAADASASPAAAAADDGQEASSSGSSSEAVAAEDTWDDAALMKRIRAVREAERGQVRTTSCQVCHAPVLITTVTWFWSHNKWSGVLQQLTGVPCIVHLAGPRG